MIVIVHKHRAASFNKGLERGEVQDTTEDMITIENNLRKGEGQLSGVVKG